MGLWHADAIERQLAYCDNNAVRRADTRGEYWDERVRMMQHWSGHLDFFRNGAKVLKANSAVRGTIDRPHSRSEWHVSDSQLLGLNLDQE